MRTISAVVAAFACAAISMAHAQLINPYTRFENLTISFPNSSFPVLQADFESPPDCGEESYIGRGRLVGRRALVTGGDSGIGRAVVIAFMREGASVAINYLPEEERDAQALADFLEAEFPSQPLIRIPGDLLNETFCGELVQEAVQRLGGLDILVNNAGFGGITIGPRWRNITTHSTEQFDRVFRTNVYAPFFVTRAAIPYLPPGSSLIYTISGRGVVPAATALDYAASKAALRHILASVAIQLAPYGIRANGVSPGPVYTPFLPANGMTNQVIGNVGDVANFGRVAQPVEVSPLFVSLADDALSYTSGSVFGVHGAEAAVW